MKKIIWRLILGANGLLIATLVMFVLLSELYPFSPGDVLYPIQEGAEQARLHFATAQARRGEQALLLAERRLANLAMAEEPNQVEACGLSFDKALREAVEHIEEAPGGEQSDLYTRLDTLLVQAQVVVRSLEFYVDVGLIDSLQDKLGRMQAAGSVEQLGQLALRDISAEPVPFWEEDVDHSLYPLYGGHFSVACGDCHPNGLYTNTPTECSSCHEAPHAASDVDDLSLGRLLIGAFRNESLEVSSGIVYPDHFEGKCSDCHTVFTWVPIRFNHEGISECQSCHADDLPIDPDAPGVKPVHYPGDCQLCHQDVDDWAVIHFDHQQAPNAHDCYACHAGETPEDHYAGECVDCHVSMEDWNEIYYGHSGDDENCLACHEGDTPEKHYLGQCSGCHNTSDWNVVNFMHPAGTSDCNACHTMGPHYDNWDCSICHVGNGGVVAFRHGSLGSCDRCHSAPNDHYGSQCNDCHGLSDWGDLTFDHSGNTDCMDCHASAAPADHFAFACNVCHSVGNWSTMIYDHTDEYDCLDCHASNVPADHYIGECQSCHRTDNWLNYTFDHTHYQDCVDCHFSPGHYPGQCSNCHTTGDWGDVSIDHTNYGDECNVCHNPPSGHWPGVCGNCHNTQDWSDYTFDHTGYTNCRACHAQDRPPNHPRGQCSRCHTTDGWTDDTTIGDLAAGTIEAPTLKDSFSLLAKIDELLAKDKIVDDDEPYDPAQPAMMVLVSPNVQKTLTPEEPPELPGDPGELPNNPEFPYNPELPMNPNGSGIEAVQVQNEDLFQLAEEVIQTQAWQQFREEFEDVAPVE